MSRLKGDEIVISGISGCFPDAEDVQQLSEKLYNKIDMVRKCDDYSHIKHPEFPKYVGKIKETEKFDATFFRVTHWQAATFDPIGRILLEQTFAALFDAGVNPETLKGAKLGVFVSSAQTDAGTLGLFDVDKHNSFVISGSSKTMLANRISYWIDGKGPSYGIDYGCSGSTAGLEMAYNRIKSGEIDCAIVSGCNLCTHPVLTMNMKRAKLLCLDGKTKCFDKNGDGYVRSDAINVLFVQRAKDAKRIYSEVCYVKGKYFAAPDGSFSLTRNPKDVEQFFEEFYSEIDVSPNDVEYVEANGFGLAEADGVELDVLGKVFGKEKSIKIGSVKSNIGNTEASSGVSSVIKMCVAYQKGEIPANLHYSDPQNHIPAVKEERIRVVTENAPFNRSFVAINNSCYNGSNYHILLKGHYNPKDPERYKSSIPRLVLISGRQEDCVTKVLDILETNPIDPEQYALLNNFFKYNVPGYTGRGYTILDSVENKKTVCLARSFEFYSGNTRPVWFLYSGMGSQWAGMGEGLLRLPVFAAAIERCNKVLLPKGLDIVKIITDKDAESFNIINNFIGITAVQIGLTDVLKSLNIVPDNIIGHSVGELGSAYADGSLTAEETILASYSRAIVSHQTPFIKGKMAAIGLGHKEVVKLCPPEIQIACHNSSESATISGPADIVTEFVKTLTEQGIFAKEVASSNIAFHSRYIAKAGPAMLALQRQFIKKPKLRSSKWLSTSYLPEDWHKPESKYASPEYFTHNLLNSVLFEEAAALIPDDAIIIEVAPHGLLQAIMKRSHSKCMNLSLTRRGEKDSVKLLLETIGKLYQVGLNPNIDALYPKVEFPVSTETPLLSHLVGWEHSTDWTVDKFVLEVPQITKIKEFIFSVHDDDYNFLKDHIRNGVNVLPEAAIIVFVWETLAEYNGMSYEDLAVVFDSIKFYREIVIKPEETLKLNITIQNAANKFEVTYRNQLVADGFIIMVKKTEKKCGEILLSENENHLNSNDVYILLSFRGYSYEGKFKSINSTNIERNKGTIKWNNHWIPFLDSIIQFNSLSTKHDGVSTVKYINKLTINVDEHRNYKYKTPEGVDLYNAVVLKDVGDTKCGGVVFEDIVFNKLPKVEIKTPSLKTLQFIAHVPLHEVDMNIAFQVNLQIISENVYENVIRITEVITENESTITNKIKEVSQEIPLPNMEIETMDAENYACMNKSTILYPHVLIFSNFFQNYGKTDEKLNEVRENTFVMTVENRIVKKTDCKTTMEIITMMHVSNQTIILMKQANQLAVDDLSVIAVETDNIENVKKLKNELKNDKSIALVLEKKPNFCIQRVINDVIKYNDIFLFIIDEKSPKFTTTSNYYKSQIRKGLKINMLENDKWGSFIYTPANAKPKRPENVKLIATEMSNVESLTWTEDAVMSNKHMIQVYYSGLSTKDCKKLSENPNNNCFGMDFSGIDSRGNRVMGLLPQGALASAVEADYDLLWPVPQHWTLEQAATVPLPYVHAFYCLAIRCSLYRNGNVFITGAAGALGQAVISVAHSLGCTVFATVGNADKKRFLLQLFPELDENNIGYTYEAAFREMVVSRTKNKRCNIVINCGSGKVRESAMGCVGFMKYFLDIDDSDQIENKLFTMYYLEEDRVYKAVDLSNIFCKKFNRNKKVLQVMLSEGIAKGFVKPLSSVTFAPSQISRAFGLLLTRNNRGRVLVKIKDPGTLSVAPRIILHSNKTYIILCDGTELGVELIDFLTKRGARLLVIHCKPKSLSGYFHVKYSSWSKLGVTVEFSSDDLQTQIGCENLIKNGNKLGSIDGIFITKNNFVTKSIRIEQDNGETALVASNLDVASRKCKDLRYFVVIATTLANVTYDYEMGELEKCCLLRNERREPSLFLRHAVLNDKKLQPTSLSALFNAMESSLKHKYVCVLSTDSANTNIQAKNDKPESQITKTNTNFDGGLEAFYRHVMENEFIATEPIVQMKTKSSLSYKHELLVDPEDTYVMMIPGFEGNYKIFDSVSERLKKPAMVLQLSPNLNDNIQEMAKKLLNYLKLRFYIKSPFYLMGYSFGVNVALEVAALLEKDGLVGVVYCLDSSPDAMKIHLDAYLGNLTDEQLQNSIIKHFYKLLAGKEPTELNEILEKTSNWTDKVEVFLRKIKSHVHFTHQYMINILQTAYDRIKMAKAYKPTLTLESELVLLKGVPHPKAKQLGDDYNLSKYSNKPVQVYNIESDHAQAPFDCRVSNFMNRTFVL